MTSVMGVCQEIKSQIPEDFMEKHLGEVEGTTLFGKPITTFTREELLAGLAFAAGEGRRQQEQHQRTLDMFSDINKPRG